MDINIDRGKRARIYKAWSSGWPINKICKRYKINPQILEELRKRYDWEGLKEEERKIQVDDFVIKAKKSNDVFFDVLAIVMANYHIKAKTGKITTPEVAQLCNTIATFKKLKDQSIDDADIGMNKMVKALDKLMKENKDMLEDPKKVAERLLKDSEKEKSE